MCLLPCPAVLYSLNSVAQASLKLLVLLPQPPLSRGCRESHDAFLHRKMRHEFPDDLRGAHHHVHWDLNPSLTCGPSLQSSVLAELATMTGPRFPNSPTANTSPKHMTC